MKSRGFTLIELMIVMSVLGVVLMISSPSFLAVYRQLVTRAAVNRFVVVHAMARSSALRHNRVAELHIDAAGPSFWVEVDTSGTGMRDTVGQVHRLREGIRMTADRAVLCFDARGLTTTRGACEAGDVTMQFEVAGYVQRVQTTVLGKVMR